MAVEPRVLEGALAAILDLIALDEVVQYHGATEAQRGSYYDAAIVTPGLDRMARAEVVITLPDTGEPSRDPRGQVSAPGVLQDVDITGGREVIALLDEHAPIEVTRGGRLRRARERCLW